MGNVGGGLKRKDVLPRVNAEFPAVFISPKSELLRKAWLIEGNGGSERKDDSSPGVPFIKFLDWCHNLAIFSCQRKYDILLIIYDFHILSPLIIQVPSHHPICEN